MRPHCRPWRIDITLSAITFYPNALPDEWCAPGGGGRFAPYLSAVVDGIAASRVEQGADISCKGLDLQATGGSGGSGGGVTAVLGEQLRGVLVDPACDQELTVELWHNRTFPVPDRLVGTASVPVAYLWQLAQAQGCCVGGANQPAAATGTTAATATGTGCLLFEQAFALNLQPAERYAAKYNALRQVRGGRRGPSRRAHHAACASAAPPDAPASQPRARGAPPLHPPPPPHSRRLPVCIHCTRASTAGQRGRPCGRALT